MTTKPTQQDGTLTKDDQSSLNVKRVNIACAHTTEICIVYKGCAFQCSRDVLIMYSDLVQAMLAYDDVTDRLTFPDQPSSALAMEKILSLLHGGSSVHRLFALHSDGEDHNHIELALGMMELFQYLHINTRCAHLLADLWQAVLATPFVSTPFCGPGKERAQTNLVRMEVLSRTFPISHTDGHYPTKQKARDVICQRGLHMLRCETEMDALNGFYLRLFTPTELLRYVRAATFSDEQDFRTVEGNITTTTMLHERMLVKRH
jgi:hypothetical protein